MRIVLGIATCCLLGAVVAAGLLARDGAGAGAAGPAPGMALNAPIEAPIGQTFSLSVAAAPPAPNTAGFAAEVLFPAGTEWLPRPSCPDEARVTVDGAPPPFCYRDTGVSDKARHFVLSSVFPPFPPLDTPLVDLIELDFRCNTPGTKTLVLTAVPDSAYGAVYFDTSNNQVTVKTVQHDIDGDTAAENVADTHIIDCLGGPTWTPMVPPTTTPTSTPTTTATPTATIDFSSLDTNGDGCADIRELGADPVQGGMRDPEHFWDFYDVPAGVALTRDLSVSSLDMFAVIGRFNYSGDPGIDPLASPPPAGYHSAYDRGSIIGPDVWNLAAADGSIAATDIFGVLGQFNHSCA